MPSTDTNPELAVSFLILILIGFPIYIRYGNSRIAKSKVQVLERFTLFEGQLEYAVSEYKSYTNNHPYVWGESSYDELKSNMLESACWSVYPMYFPSAATKFDLKVDEEIKSIYIAIGTSSFDWKSLYHYEDWLESMRGVGAAIQEHKERGSKFGAQ